MRSEPQQAVLQTRSKAKTSGISAESHMSRTHAMILLFAMAGGAGCHHTKPSQFPAPDGSSVVTLQVSGMMKAKSGAT